MEELISGGISGGIKNPYSNEAAAHAELYYEEIRHFKTDVYRIAENVKLTPEQELTPELVLLIKEYLFVDEHLLENGMARFDPCFAIAESWRRLAFDPNNIKEHDKTLLKHELKEMELIRQGYSQDDAHKEAEKDFNFQLESDEYYISLGYNPAELSGSKDNNGAIKRSKKVNWEERY